MQVDPKRETTGDLDNQGLDFSEFMTCIEGDSIDFETFKKRLPPPPAADMKEDKAVIEEIFEYFKIHNPDSYEIDVANGTLTPWKMDKGDLRKRKSVKTEEKALRCGAIKSAFKVIFGSIFGF